MAYSHWKVPLYVYVNIQPHPETNSSHQKIDANWWLEDKAFRRPRRACTQGLRNSFVRCPGPTSLDQNSRWGEFIPVRMYI